jgi:hypothetical protein
MPSTQSRRVVGHMLGGTLLMCAVAAGFVSCGGSSDGGASADMSMATSTSCCGKPGDTGNSKGVGKYCTDPSGVECRGNSLATVCSSLGDTPQRKTTFCTAMCDPANVGYCGENASCTQDSSTKVYGCTPNACTTNLPPGCTP